MPRVDSTKWADILTRCFARAGLNEESNRCVVASMIETSLRGVDSHGIRLFPHYLRALQAGRVKADPAIRVERRRSSTALLDADHAFGHHAGSVAIKLCRELAAETGVGLVVVRRSTHFGAAAYFALQASRAGDIGLAFTNADALVRGANARQAVFGTNPICVTAPMVNEEPFCLDMATSCVSWNRVLTRRRDGDRLEPGWAADGDGQPTTDPDAAAMLEPIGDYKGFGLGMVVDILCGLLAGGPIAHELLAMYRAPIEQRRNISHAFGAIRIDSFTDPRSFSERLSGLAERIRAIDPVPGAERVMVPGDPEKIQFANRTRNGIPIDHVTLDEYLAIDPAFQGAVMA